VYGTVYRILVNRLAERPAYATVLGEKYEKGKTKIEKLGKK
jgi:hypothetical protein